MKKIKILIFFFLLFPQIALAQFEALLHPTENIEAVLAALYQLILTLSGGAALLMIVWGGFEWLTSAGNIGRISSAKEKISAALLGLLIVLCSYIIVSIINPDLLTGSL